MILLRKWHYGKFSLVGQRLRTSLEAGNRKMTSD